MVYAWDRWGWHYVLQQLPLLLQEGPGNSLEELLYVVDKLDYVDSTCGGSEVILFTNN